MYCPACGTDEVHIYCPRPNDYVRARCTNKKCGLYEISIDLITWDILCAPIAVFVPCNGHPTAYKFEQDAEAQALKQCGTIYREVEVAK